MYTITERPAFCLLCLISVRWGELGKGGDLDYETVGNFLRIFAPHLADFMENIADVALTSAENEQ